MENFTEYTNLPSEVQGTALQSFTSFIRNLLMMVGICATAASFSVVVISHQLFANVSKAYRDAHGYDSETDEEEEEEEEGPFEDKYLDEYNDLGDREVDDNELITFKNDYDTEETPRGIVKFAYDKETTTFTYYSNTKDLPYNFLEAIARGYVVRRDCKKVLVDTKAVLTKAEELCKKEEEEEKERKLKEEEVAEVKTGGVFATFKRYTKASLTQKEVKKVPLIEEANRYAYRGTLIDFDELFAIKSDPEEFEQLDYGTFKKLAVDNEKKNS